MVVDESRTDSVGKLLLALNHADLIDGFIDAALFEVAERLPELEEWVLSVTVLLHTDFLGGLP